MTDLYRYYDKNGVLLYVGISKSAFVRAQSHKNKSAWHGDAVFMTIENFPTKEKALEHEKRAIQAEKPVWNRMHNGSREQIESGDYFWLCGKNGRMHCTECRRRYGFGFTDVCLGCNSILIEREEVTLP